MSLPPLREVIARHGLGARKQLGQNFLLDLNLTGRIAREAGVKEGDIVYEVGPGPGGLTRALLDAGAAQVVAVEKDARCLDALAEIADAYPGRLTVHEADATTLDEVGLLPEGRPAKVVANLPYNVSTVLLTKWLETAAWPPWFSSLTLMFQKEVAERILARPNTKAYGRLSVLSQWRTKPQRLFDIPPTAFVPPPKVTSTVLRFEVLPEPMAEADLKQLQRVLQAAFGQRRKMLRSSLKALGVDAPALLEKAGIDGERRAETLSLDEFCAVTRAYAGLSGQMPPVMLC
ncbi:MAG: 16S rRNA (adenine(1518)-N(6)/adenine(1519)-N(6))-dimethyltransferase RsmA [Alphaproteobacteria bacterium]